MYSIGTESPRKRWKESWLGKVELEGEVKNEPEFTAPTGAKRLFLAT